MSYHIVGLRLVLCDEDQWDKENNVRVSPVPEILRGQTFLWEVMRGKENRGFLSLTLQTLVYASLSAALPYLQPVHLLPRPTHRKGTENG